MKKYVAQIDNSNFVYPNNSPSEYDVTINHEINDNCVSGTTNVVSTERVWQADDASNSGEWSYIGSSSFTGITYLLINEIDDSGKDQEDWLRYFEQGDTIKLYSVGNAYGFYRITSDPAFPIGNYIQFQVECLEGNGVVARGTDTTFVLEKATNSSICSDANISVTSTSATGITLSYSWSWDLNGAEPFLNQDGDLVLYSIHALSPESDFYKPWFMVDYYKETYTGQTTGSGDSTVTITPDQFNLSLFVDGNYYFEFRFIGHRCVYPVSVCATIETLGSLNDWDATRAYPINDKTVAVVHTGDTTYCVSVVPQYSRDGTSWTTNSPSSSYCTSPAYCHCGPHYGTMYFRLIQYLSNGNTLTSRVVSYTFHDPTLLSISGTTGATGNTYYAEYTEGDDCKSMIIQWSRNQVDWVDATLEFECNETQPIEIDVGDEEDIPYWRIKQIAGTDSDTIGYTYSEVVTAADIT